MYKGRIIARCPWQRKIERDKSLEVITFFRNDVPY